MRLIKSLEINPFRSLQNKSIVEGGITANLSGLNKKRMSYPTSSGVFLSRHESARTIINEYEFKYDKNMASLKELLAFTSVQNIPQLSGEEFEVMSRYINKMDGVMKQMKGDHSLRSWENCKKDLEELQMNLAWEAIKSLSRVAKRRRVEFIEPKLDLIEVKNSVDMISSQMIKMMEVIKSARKESKDCGAGGYKGASFCINYDVRVLDIQKGTLDWLNDNGTYSKYKILFLDEKNFVVHENESIHHLNKIGKGHIFAVYKINKNLKDLREGKRPLITNITLNNVSVHPSLLLSH